MKLSYNQGWKINWKSEKTSQKIHAAGNPEILLKFWNTGFYYYFFFTGPYTPSLIDKKKTTYSSQHTFLFI